MCKFICFSDKPSQFNVHYYQHLKENHARSPGGVGRQAACEGRLFVQAILAVECGAGVAHGDKTPNMLPNVAHPCWGGDAGRISKGHFWSNGRRDREGGMNLR